MDARRRRNVFVVGLTEFQRGHLETIAKADELAFHQLLPPEVAKRPDEHGFVGLLEAARGQLEAFDGTIDAIIAHWNFPTSVLVPILGRERRLRVASVEAVVACEHKYWSRTEQAVSVPEVVPAFDGFDPFDDDALESIDLDFPFWVKPVKAHSSQLGFRIETATQFHETLPSIRDGIGVFGDPFNEALAMTRLPDHISPSSGNTCLAEQIISGAQATVEGAMFEGEFSVHGVVDSPKDEHGRHFARYEYPAGAIPESVQGQMADTCERYLRHLGYDDAAWNIEFMWDEDAERLWLVEANTRISQSHSDLFAKVDGMSNHEVAIDVALGRRPAMPRGQGPFEVAAKCFLWTEEMDDGIVRRVPSRREIAEVTERFPETHVHIPVEVGDRLSELRDQSSYRYDLGTLYIGAQSRDELLDVYETCRQMLPFEIDPVDA